MQKAMTAMEFQKMKFEEECVNRGFAQGFVRGGFLMALKVKEALGIDKAVEISGFSREELENGKLDD